MVANNARARASAANLQSLHFAVARIPMHLRSRPLEQPEPGLEVEVGVEVGVEVLVLVRLLEQLQQG